MGPPRSGVGGVLRALGARELGSGRVREWPPYVCFSCTSSWRIFRETLHPAELIGTALIAGGIVLLLLGT